MASDLDKHLAEAERIVANCKQRVSDQKLVIEQLQRTGMDTTHAEGLLQVLQDALHLAEAPER
jgi:hypothetical protein